MSKQRPGVPKTLPIVAVILVVLGIASYYAIQAAATPQQLAKNVLLSALPFILIFVAIILAFITLINWVGVQLNQKIDARLHRNIEMVTIAGIGLGIFGIFQPWVFASFRIGFLTLLISTLAFILWSHIQPKRAVLHGESASS